MFRSFILICVLVFTFGSDSFAQSCPGGVTLQNISWNGWTTSFVREAFFGATPHSCGSRPHNHGIYWRVDLDIEGDPNSVEEHNAVQNQECWDAWDFMLWKA